MVIDLKELTEVPCDEWLRLFNKDGKLNLYDVLFDERACRWLIENSKYDVVAWEKENNTGNLLPFTSAMEEGKIYPVFPLEITKEVADNKGVLSLLRKNILFKGGAIGEYKKRYLFNINGELIKGLVVSETWKENFSFRSSYPLIDRWQMKIYLLSPNDLIENIFYISYYRLPKGVNKVTHIIAYKTAT